jgi:hypothetical protein
MLNDYTEIPEMFEALQVVSNSNETVQKCWHVFKSQVKKGVKLVSTILPLNCYG